MGERTVNERKGGSEQSQNQTGTDEQNQHERKRMNGLNKTDNLNRINTNGIELDGILN